MNGRSMNKSLRALGLVVFMAGALGLSTAHARNYPCSGKKGGVSHCQGDKFVCKDGTISSSKKICQ